MAATLILVALTPTAFLLPGAAPRVATTRCGLPVRCSDSMPDAAKDAVPASELAEAWRRDEKATELVEMLKGCSVYVIGLGARKSAVGRVLSRRLKYRSYDVSNLMCSTYAALQGSKEVLSLPQLVAKEPLQDVEQLSNAVLREVQQFTRSVFVAWDGGVDTASFAVMQQGLIVNLQFEATVDDDVALPEKDGEAAKEAWVEGHGKADIAVKVPSGSAADDASNLVVDALIAYIKANPAKSSEWKAEADAKLAAKDEEEE